MKKSIPTFLVKNSTDRLMRMSIGSRPSVSPPPSKDELKWLQHDLSWTAAANELEGRGSSAFILSSPNTMHGSSCRHFLPIRGATRSKNLPRYHWAEGEYIETVRREISPLLASVPSDVDGFIDWFEELKVTGPGQGDELFPWLAQHASREDMLWFLTQEVAGEAGFDDLLAMTQVKMPVTAKLEMARNYWDEMGRGRDAAMHGPLLEKLAGYLDIDAKPEHVVPEIACAR